MRRPLVLLVPALLLAALPPARAAAAADCLAAVNGVDLSYATAADLTAAMTAGRVTSEELVRAYERRITAYDVGEGKLDSVRQLHPTRLAQARRADAERAAGQVRGPLHGLPVLLKDNVGTNDMPTTAGSIALEGSIPLNDSEVVRRLRAAGAVIFGKANLSEFANWVDLSMPNGYSSLGGQVVNAYTGGDPSGSSSGSGVATSMSFSALSIGSETSGSILSPSVANSTVGVKPTVGLVSRYGVIPLSPKFDTAGPMTRTVADAAALLGVIAGSDSRDPATSDADSHLPTGADYVAGLQRSALQEARIGYDENDVGNALFDEVMNVLTGQGAIMVPIQTLPVTTFAGLTELAAIPNDFKWSLNHYLATETVPSLRVHTLSEIIAYNSQHPDKVKYGQGLLQASDATPGVAELATVQAAPTILAAQAAIDLEFMTGDLDAIVAPGAANANIGAAAGYPSVAVPAGYNDSGGPFGITFLGQAWTEPTLLGFAYAYEQATKLRQPPWEFDPALVAGGCALASPPRVAVLPGRRPKEPLAATGGRPLVLPAIALVILATLFGRSTESRRQDR